MASTADPAPVRVWLWVDVAVKAALIGLLLVGAFSGLHQFEGKAFGWRLVTYPLAAFLVPVAWYLAGRRIPTAPTSS